MPIRSSSVLVSFSEPALTVTFSEVEVFAFLLSLTLSVTVRFWAGLSTPSGLTLLTESPRALPMLTFTFDERLAPSLAICSFRRIVLLRLIVDGVPLSESVSFAACGTLTGGVFAVVGAGTGVGAGAAGVGVGVGVGVAAGGA